MGKNGFSRRFEGFGLTHPALRSYGRTCGRPLSPRRKALLQDALPTVQIPLNAPDASLIPTDLFATHIREAWCEIGFGGGEHLLTLARAHPDIGLLGADPFVTGLVRVLDEVISGPLHNIRLSQEDIRQVLPRLRPASLGRIYCLFPDPWPKARHHKRRLIQPDFVAELARVLRPGRQLRLATDWADYANHCLYVFRQSPDFRWTATCARDWRHPPKDHAQTTRYQDRRLGNCAPVFLEFTRI